MISPETIEARAELWERGVIGPWYLKDPQLDYYLMLKRERFPFAEFTRRGGKTTTTLVHVCEQLTQNNEWIWRWCCPWKNQTREIIQPEMDRLQRDCPERERFRYYKTDSFYEKPTTGSRMYLRGVNDDRGESARGSFAHGITCDEYGTWKEPDYIVNEVLMAQLLSTNGQLIKTSTPPRDLGHRYYAEREQAARENRFIQKNIWAFEGHLYTRSQIEEICRAVGGPNSPAWLREYLCQPVSDPDSLVIPEFDEATNVVDDDYPTAPWPTFYVGGDSGADDNTAILFAFYDFVNNEVVVDQEYVTRGKTTKEIVENAKTIERTLWGETKPRQRVYDADKQLLIDISAEHQWTVSLPRKADRLAAINELRIEVGARRFKIKKRCVNTIRQMKVGMWKDEKHTDFERSESLGHLDAVIAAVYLNRSIDRKFNPIPVGYGADHGTHYIPRSQQDQELSKLFGSRKGFK